MCQRLAQLSTHTGGRKRNPSETAPYVFFLELLLWEKGGHVLGRYNKTVGTINPLAIRPRKKNTQENFQAIFYPQNDGGTSTGGVNLHHGFRLLPFTLAHCSYHSGIALL